MEKDYAQALWRMIGGGMTPGKAVRALQEVLQRNGRTSLLPRIGRAFARIAEREERRNAVVLTVAREKDEKSARRDMKKVLAESDADPKDVETKIDGSLVGGWRLEGREHLFDASYKKFLLDMYNRTTDKV